MTLHSSPPAAGDEDGTTSPRAQPGDPGSNGGELEEVRQILLGPDRQQLTRIEERLADPELQAQDVSRVLPRAILLRPKDDPALTRALSSVVESSLQISVKRNPRVLADAIFPVIGPAIRKSIAAALAGMLDRLNRAREESLSPRGIRWRLEAWRTGRPFGEVVLLHTLVFRVEQVFLIHRETSLLLQHLVAPAAPVQDPHLVSGMLAAIEDFVRDSFAAGEDQDLDQLQIGELTLIVEQGPQAFLAAAVRGSAPPELRVRMQEALETIHAEHSELLADFRGEAEAFEVVRPDLEACLQERFQGSGQAKKPVGKAKKPVGKAWIAGAVLLAALLAYFGIARPIWTRRERASDLARLVQALTEEPGYEVLSAGLEDGRIRVAGWRDPLAREPGVLFRSAAVDAETVDARWIPFQSSTPSIALVRAVESLDAPDSVQLSLDDGVLRARGFAPGAWTARASLQAPLIPGVRSFDARELVDPDRAEIERRRRAIEAVRLEFAPGEDPGTAAASLEGLRANLAAADAAARAAGTLLHVRVLGWASGASGSPDARAGRELAERVQSELEARAPGALIWSTAGASETEGPDWPPSRSGATVTFSLTLLGDGRAPATAR